MSMQRERSSIVVHALLAMALVSLPAWFCSCAKSGGAGNITAQGNSAEVTIKAPVSRIGSVARAAMIDRKMTIAAYSMSEQEGHIVAYIPAGGRMELLIHPVDTSNNKVTAVTNGSASDQEIASRLLSRIASKAP